MRGLGRCSVGQNDRDTEPGDRLRRHRDDEEGSQGQSLHLECE